MESAQREAMSHNATRPATTKPQRQRPTPATAAAKAAAASSSAVTKAAQPTKVFFDPYNSSATGHQRAENRLSGSTAWRDSRGRKLAAQFRGGAAAAGRLYDTVGAGSETFGRDGRKENGGWERGASGLRGKGQLSIAEAMGARTAKRGGGGGAAADDCRADAAKGIDGGEWLLGHVVAAAATASAANDKNCDRAQPPAATMTTAETTAMSTPAAPQIFANLTVYVNGSTAPLISDHKLKSLLAAHGARTALALGRRSVTHVILGSPCAHGGGGGAGGGLSSSKLQKEIARVGGKGIKFVRAEWVVESVKAGRRLDEGRFQVVGLRGKGQRSVHGLLGGVGGKGGSKAVVGDG